MTIVSDLFAVGVSGAASAAGVLWPLAQTQIDARTLIPVGMAVGGIAAVAALSWRIGRTYSSVEQRLADLERRAARMGSKICELKDARNEQP